MSKAFVKDDAIVEEIKSQPRTLTEASETYITNRGFERLEKELHSLKSKPSPENKVRIDTLETLMRTAKVIVPENQPGDRVLFGATVTVEDESGRDQVFKLVGVDETQITERKISWISPIAQALLRARAGDTVTVKTPKGEEDLFIKTVQFIPIN
jgi:transcription elongation factor GreB